MVFAKLAGSLLRAKQDDSMQTTLQGQGSGALSAELRTKEAAYM